MRYENDHESINAELTDRYSRFGMRLYVEDQV
jgi:hypothetical protein